MPGETVAQQNRRLDRDSSRRKRDSEREERRAQRQAETQARLDATIAPAVRRNREAYAAKVDRLEQQRVAKSGTSEYAGKVVVASTFPVIELSSGKRITIFNPSGRYGVGDSVTVVLSAGSRAMIKETGGRKS